MHTITPDLLREAIEHALGTGRWLMFVRHEGEATGRIAASFPERYETRRAAQAEADALCRHGHDAYVLDLQQVPK